MKWMLKWFNESSLRDDKIKVDIVGGSLAGLSTAISLKENDNSIKVVVHEKHKKIGYNH